MSQEKGPLPIQDVAAKLGLGAEDIVPYGRNKAKMAELPKAEAPRGKLVLVSAITPTNAGEGKTTTSIGLAQGLERIGEKVCLALREPSLGPIFGRKGGGTGGGRSTLWPEDEINLHFTGDFHAITSANNLLAAMVDNSIYHGNSLEIDSRRVLWRRVIDLNDRALRHTVIGLGGRLQGVPRETGFDITPASEVMAALCLAEDADDLRARLARLLVARSFRGDPVRAEDLGAVGSMMVLLKDAIYPNLVQTGEGVPAVVHCGPFANIAHGCNSVLATKTALAHADWVITEAGFGFDLGAEKFFDIKCVSSGLRTAAVVLVATVRALKRHGGVKNKELANTDAAAVERGLGNLRKHVENIQAFGQTPIVALNHFVGDSEEEVEVIRRQAERLGVPFAVTRGFAEGGTGAEDLARTLVEHAQDPPGELLPLYDWSEPIPDKIEKVAKTIYGARTVHYTKRAQAELREIEKLGYGGLPVCIAKTPTSLTDDPTRTGRPQDFEVTVSSFVVSAGAGFVVPLLGDILRMPGLPSTPQALGIDLVDGETVGLMAK